MENPRVMLTVGSYDKQGGTNTFVRNLSDRISKRGIYTVVMSHRLKGEPFKDRKINNKLFVHYFPAFPRKRYLLPLYVLRFILMAFSIVPIIIKHRINIILTGETEALPFLIAKLFGVKIIIRGGNPFTEVTKIEFGRKKRRLNNLIFWLIDSYEKIILLFADDIIILSEWEEGILRRSTKKKMKIIRYAVDVDKFKPLNVNKNNYLIYVGRISYSKGIDKLLKCFDFIRKNANTKLVLVGPLEDYKSIDELLKNCKYRKDVIYLGEKKTEEIPGLLGENYIFVHTAHDLGNAPLEAASSGLPVIVLGEKYSEKYVIKSENELDFAKKVINLLKNKKEYLKVASFNRDFVIKNHSWVGVCLQYIDAFKKVIAIK